MFEPKTIPSAHLSKQSPTDPIEGWEAGLLCPVCERPGGERGVPWSEWITVSESGWRLPMAMPRAEVTRPAVADWSMDQPTTRRLNTSGTTGQ